jgi:hypothetical protein
MAELSTGVRRDRDGGARLGCPVMGRLPWCGLRPPVMLGVWQLQEGPDGPGES